MQIISSIRALFPGADNGITALELRAQPTLNTPSVPLGGVGFEWAYEIGGGSSTVAGEAINNETALRISTVYACIRVLAQSIASLPLVLYERTTDGAKEAIDAPLHYILGTEPNIEMDRHRFWVAIITALQLTGNAYAQIVRNGANQVAELYPLLPTITEPYRLPSGVLAYRTRQGTANGAWKEIPAADVLHFALLTLDGINGMSPIHQAREALGLTRAAEKAGSKLFGNGSRPGGILTGPVELTSEQKAQAKASWEATHGGSNQGGTAVLPGEWKYTALALSPEDSQFIQLRGFQRTEIAALYGVPPNMIGDITRMSNNNAEQYNLSFISDTLRPIISTVECELNRKLMPQIGRKANAYFARFDLTERYRGDYATQTKGYALGKQWGWYSTNDIRSKLGENRLDDPAANVYLFPVNMANMAQLPAQAEEINIDELPANQSEKDDNDPQTQP